MDKVKVSVEQVDQIVEKVAKCIIVSYSESTKRRYHEKSAHCIYARRFSFSCDRKRGVRV